MDTQVIIIGAGISGLSAAIELRKRGIDFKILEANTEIGGRVRTKNIDGYLIDRGFQVLLTAYPEAKALLDYKALHLQHFQPGSLILQANGKKSRIGDPFRDFSSLVPTLLADVGGISQKLKILSLRNEVTSMSIEDIFDQAEISTLERLKQFGFGHKMINNFFKPFFSGIFLEKDLNTSRRMFDFVYKMFSEGVAALPQNGMKEIPKQLAGHLASASIHLEHKVKLIDKNVVLCENGVKYEAEHILLACEPNSLSRSFFKHNMEYVGTTCIHMISDEDPIGNKLIALNATGKGAINNLCTISNVSTNYSKDKHLISLSTVGCVEHKGIEKMISSSLKGHFKQAETWKTLDVQDVVYALPNQKSVSHDSEILNRENIWITGDFMNNGSINGAMKSGQQVAMAIGQKYDM